MHSIIVTAFILSTAAAVEQRIVGGSDANPGEFPYVVPFGYVPCGRVKLFRCTATILTKNWVLTTASCCRQCVDYPFAIRSGSIYRSQGGHLHLVNKRVRHHKFWPDGQDKDEYNVCLMRVIEPFEFGKDVQKVKLAGSGFNVELGDNVTVVGWGYTNKTGPPAERQQKGVNYKVADCGDAAEPWKICSLPPENGVPNQGILSGDNGGPLLKGDVQIALAWQTHWPLDGVPTQYIDIRLLVDWIKMKLGNEVSELDVA